MLMHVLGKNHLLLADLVRDYWPNTFEFFSIELVFLKKKYVRTVLSGDYGVYCINCWAKVDKIGVNRETCPARFS